MNSYWGVASIRRSVPFFSSAQAASWSSVSGPRTRIATSQYDAGKAFDVADQGFPGTAGGSRAKTRCAGGIGNAAGAFQRIGRGATSPARNRYRSAARFVRRSDRARRADDLVRPRSGGLSFAASSHPEVSGRICRDLENEGWDQRDRVADPPRRRVADGWS